MNDLGLAGIDGGHVCELRIAGIDRGDVCELIVLVDLEDVLAPLEVMGADPDTTLPLLLPGPEPRRVEIAHCDCGDPSCGSLSVVVRGAGDEVFWEAWENTLGFEVPPELRFDRLRYSAEVERADRERQWESDERRFAREVAALIDDDAAAALAWRGLQYLDVAPAGTGAIAVRFRAEMAGARWSVYAMFAVGDDPGAVPNRLVRKGPSSWPAVAWWGENEAAAFVQPPMAGRRWRMWEPTAT